MKVLITYKNTVWLLVFCVSLTALGCANSPRHLLSQLWKSSPQTEEASLADAQDSQSGDSQKSSEKPSGQVTANTLAKSGIPSSNEVGRVRIASLSNSSRSPQSKSGNPFSGRKEASRETSEDPFLQGSKERTISRERATSRSASVADNAVDPSRQLPLDFQGSRPSANKRWQVARNSDSRSQLERLRAMLEEEEKKASKNRASGSQQTKQDDPRSRLAHKEGNEGRNSRQGIVSAKMEVSSQKETEEKAKPRNEKGNVRNAHFSSQQEEQEDSSNSGNPFEQFSEESKKSEAEEPETGSPIIRPRISGEARQGMILDSSALPSKFESPSKRTFPSSSEYRKKEKAIQPVSGEQSSSDKNGEAIHADFSQTQNPSAEAVWASVDKGDPRKAQRGESSGKSPAFLSPEADQWSSLSEKDDVAPAPPMTSSATAEEVVSSSHQDGKAASWDLPAASVEQETPMVPWPILLGFGLGVICLIVWGIKRRATVNW